MTVRLLTGAFGASKRVLEDQLNRDPAIVRFDDPSPFGDRPFTGADIKPNASFGCVMDPATRRRFATVSRGRENLFKVS